MSGAHALQRALPRKITPTVLWAGGCVAVELENRMVHSHFSMYAIKGSEAVLLLDTGHPQFLAEVESGLDEFLDGRPVDYILPTHAEFPHMGLLPKWMNKYPDAQLVGDIDDWTLLYPEFADRMRPVELGGGISLGDRTITIFPAVWYDLPDTIWAFDSKDAVLFCSDGFSATHLHLPGQCGLTASEQSMPEQSMMRITNEIVFPWTRYLDIKKTFQSLDRLVSEFEPRLIAPAHGPVIDDPRALLPTMKRGMIDDRGRASNADTTERSL